MSFHLTLKQYNQCGMIWPSYVAISIISHCVPDHHSWVLVVLNFHWLQWFYNLSRTRWFAHLWSHWSANIIKILWFCCFVCGHGGCPLQILLHIVPWIAHGPFYLIWLSWFLIVKFSFNVICIPQKQSNLHTHPLPKPGDGLYKNNNRLNHFI